MQPQWIFDNVNSKRILPLDDYLPESVLPPHLSPFVDENNEERVEVEEPAPAEEKQDSQKLQGNTSFQDK